MVDGIALEALGKPIAMCVGSEFVPEANVRKETLGMPDLQLVVVPAPLGPTQEACAKAERALANIVAVLTGGEQETTEIKAGATGDSPKKAVSEEVVFVDSFEATLEAIDLCYEKGWTDGLPIVPATRSRVRAMLKAIDRDPGEVLGRMPPREGIVTVEKVAINAVMAGCLPEYFPVVLAGVEAVLEEKFNLHWVQLSTGSQCPLLIVSGPIAKELGVNSGTNVFGGGFRANAAIGRAIRLVLWNIGGAIPGIGRMAVMGHPGEFSYCIAERDDSPWQPLHAERGFALEDSCVTVVSGGSFQGMDPTLSRIAARMAAFNHFHGVGHEAFVVALSPQVAWTLSKQGWTKEDVRQYLWHSARVPMGEILNRGGSIRGVGSKGDDTFIGRRGALEGRWPRWVDITNPETRAPVTNSPEDILVVVAGGTAFGWNALIEGSKQSVPVTKRIVRKTEGRIARPGSLEEAREEVREKLEKFAANSPYRFNPEVELVSSVIDGLAHNELKYGYAYCTCQVPAGIPAADRRIICPCEDLAKEIAEFGHCDCALFVKR